MMAPTEADAPKEEAPYGGRRGFSEMDAPVGEPVQAGHVSVRRGVLACDDRRYPVSDS
jgi:hypothetical protein